MKLALVHDYLIQDGGAERVLQAFQDIWPDAPTYALLYDPKRFSGMFRNREIKTSLLQKIPFSLKRYKWLMPLMPAATERYDLSDFDVVLSSTSAFAKGIITRPETLHICYCHTPTRYLWSDTHSYISEIGLPGPIKSIMPLILSAVRSWDRMAADRVDYFVANSDTVRRRIRKYYRHDSTVIHPPVDTFRYRISNQIDNYYVAGGRLVAYKRFDIVVKAFNKLGIPLKIFGEGPEFNSLRKLANKNIDFLGKLSEPEKTELYSHGLAYLHPQEEDFGITAVEAMAAGRPVIAFGKGGALETVIEGVTGTFIHEQTWEELANAVIRFEPERYDPQTIRTHAEQYDVEEFKSRIQQLVERAHRAWNSGDGPENEQERVNILEKNRGRDMVKSYEDRR
ncbi:glycosyltransferase [Patescibacteria group bacterium]|nr:glycosyltransferase [Patescibacteria group bacterium]MBU1028822.1 glycosyltransferase [Patescibacteria group bacterium]MBU1916411.1 glycosyltransferase [Patescibacteria group bacterium]